MQTATAYRAIADITVHTNPRTGIGIPNPAIATIVTGSQDTTVTTVVVTALPFGSDLVATTAAGGDFDRVIHRVCMLEWAVEPHLNCLFSIEHRGLRHRPLGTCSAPGR